MIEFGVKRKRSESVQFNCRLPIASMKMIEDGCRATGLSQSKFLTLCLVKQAQKIPELTRDLQKAVWQVMAKDVVDSAALK